MMGSMLRRASLGDGSTLSLDFTTGVLDPLLTFTRSSSGTYIGADGLVKTATNNVARFDHDPTTLSPRGLQIEATATNVCEQGQYCWGAGTTISWSRGAGISVNSVNGTSGANAVPRIDGPDGGSLTGTSIFKDSGSTFVRLQYVDFAVQANTTYTWSAYVRAPSGGNPYIRLGAFNGGTWLNTTGGCSLSSVTITNTGGAGSVFNGVPSGSWVRVWVTFTTQAAQTLATIAFYPDANTTNAATMYVWGSQVETGSGPSSVIPTGASQGTRNADECSMTGTNFSSWFNATEGAFLAHARRMMTTDVGRIASANDNTANESIDIGASTTGQFIVTDGGSALATITPGTVTANTAFKIAGAFKLNDVQAALGGTLGTPDTGVTMPTVNQLMIGRQAGGSPVYLNGTVSLLKFWPTRLPNAQLQSLTT